MICEHESPDKTDLPFIGLVCPACYERLSQPQLMEGAVVFNSLIHIGDAHERSHARWLASFLAKCREAVK